jgi:O-antigen/teichoic acid export membrane protein
MLSRTQPPEVVGWYNAAYNLTGSLLFIFGGLSVAMVPTLTKAYWTDTGLVHRWYARSVKFILLLGLPMATGGSLVALPLFLFLYGESFTPAAFTFKIIVWDVPLLLFTSFSGNMTTIVGEERAAARIYFTAAAANVALNLVLIPAYSLYGAAVATVLTDIVAAVQFYLLLGRKLRLPNLSSVAARVALACGVMAASLLLLQTLGAALWLLILSGVLVYGAMIVVTRLLDADEQRLLRRAVSQMGRLHT